MGLPRVYVTRIISEHATFIMHKECHVSGWSGSDPVPPTELAENIEKVDGLFCMLTDKIDKDLLDKAKNLKVIATMSAGYDHLDLEEIKKRGIRVGYTPDTLTDTTAELTVGLLLATCRRFMLANAEARDGRWQAWSPFWMCGGTLKDATVGFYGFGRIGQAVARRLIPFKTKQILYTTRSEKPEARELGASKVDFDYLLGNSDFIVVCCSLNEGTREIFDLEAFKKMKKLAVFINTARGDVVKQDDLVVALQNKIIWGAGLDVMTPEPLPVDHELFKLDNCVILPHIGSATQNCRLEMAALTAANIVTALKGEPMPSELVLN
ncbi:glyoxylate reductase/hydroxypyruvate reductase [Harmonia axyridis]|uniref:glyoxylate reductase/hydroxypyruvate reductase n=1 Tax=Harmonia axyridis TaxID=115357 RepID=UPI001E279C4B|nr:glyoxylate reductase/hydroxypyruvate reductase [Harmonia axyridis]XP_045476184.1 glyoxylate reductase/hydroxypyruvate reductase [Harmonia axyridis]